MVFVHPSYVLSPTVMTFSDKFNSNIRFISRHLPKIVSYLLLSESST